MEKLYNILQRYTLGELVLDNTTIRTRVSLNINTYLDLCHNPYILSLCGRVCGLLDLGVLNWVAVELCDRACQEPVVSFRRYKSPATCSLLLIAQPIPPSCRNYVSNLLGRPGPHPKSWKYRARHFTNASPQSHSPTCPSNTFFWCWHEEKACSYGISEMKSIYTKLIIPQ